MKLILFVYVNTKIYVYIHICVITHIKENLMNKELINDDLAYTLAEFYKIMSDHTRMKIIYALTKKELCVGELSEIVNMSQTAVSYQLRILRGARLVKYRRDGKMVYYSIDDDHVSDIINTTIIHLGHEE